MSELSPLFAADRFRAAILRQVGLQFEDAKLPFLEELLARRTSALDLSSDAYLWSLEHEPAPSEIRALAEQLTVNETYFFRNFEQFEALAQVVLPERMQAKAASRSLQILSAGCASGEEPYSLAIVAREMAPAPTWDVSIRGVDLSPSALEKARRARFSAWSLRETTPDLRQRWFDGDGRDFLLREPIRSAVRFEQRNLTKDDSELWPLGGYDVVFCRNVVMYFSPPHAAAVIRRIALSLAPGGYLFLGHAETLRGLSDDFHLCNTHGTFYYQCKGVTARPIHVAAANRPPFPTHSEPGTPEEWIDAIREASERVEVLASGRRAPAAPPVQRPSTGWSVTGILDALAKENFTDALAALRGLPAEADDDPDILLLKATLHIHAGDHVVANETCWRLLELDEMNAGAHFVLGLCCEKAKDHPGAVQHYATAIYLDPSFAMPHLRLGLLARGTGQVAATRRELGRALVLLKREDSSRLLLFGGGFNRRALIALCEGALRDNPSPS